MKNYITRLLTLGLAVCAFNNSNAQYCSPAPNTTGSWIGLVSFTSLPSGLEYNSVAGFKSEGYANRSGSSSGNIAVNCPFSINVSLNSCGNRGVINYNLRVFADWNQDNDFDDANETVVDIDNSFVNGNCAFASHYPSIIPPLSAVPGGIRIRIVLREGGAKATACGNDIGEVEDYRLTLAGNQAPVLNNTGTPFINPLVETQTANSGFLLNKIVSGSLSDPDICGPQKGIAIIESASANGSWQYKIGAGAWTSVGNATLANALLIPDTCKLRFVPTGPGTARIIIKAWDRTAGTMGQYYNITGVGGITPFSIANDTLSLTTYSTAATAEDIKLYMVSNYSPSAAFNIFTSSLSQGTAILKEAESLTSNNLDGYGTDIAMDQLNKKLVWCGGDGFSLLRSNYDGTGIETLMANLDYPTGVATSGSKIFVIDYGIGIYSMNLDGSGRQSLFGSAGLVNDIVNSGDIEYYSNKLYFANQPTNTSDFKIMQANTDGTGSVELVSTPNQVSGIDITGDIMYWVEYTGTVSTLKSMPIAGGTITTLATGNNQQWFDLLADAPNERIYILAPEQGGNPASVLSVPIAGGTVTKRLNTENSFSSMVFERTMVSLPLKFVDINAQLKQASVEVKWKVASEDPGCTYTVERSTNGVNYSGTGTVKGIQKTDYAWLDSGVPAGTLYYRVKAVDADGKPLYSAIVTLLSGSTGQSLKVYPTLVENKTINLSMTNLPKGLYRITMYNGNGQPAFNKQIAYAGGSMISSVSLPAAMPAGVYSVTVSSDKKSLVQKLVVR